MARAHGKGKRPRKKTKKLADRISRLKSVQKPEKTNPFELHINRQKNVVIGQKTKHDKGLPGVARAKAMKKRKETLLQEYKKKHKTNTMIDRRIGENDATMSLEEKMSARFTAERQVRQIRKKMKRGKKIFNLNDEEDLTHYGQSLAEIEKFDDPRSDDDSEEEKLADDFLRQTNFGGLFKKKDNADTNDNLPNEKSREERIDEMIALSKLKKLDRQNVREELFTLTEKLDKEWNDVRSLLNMKEAATSGPASSTEPTSYDMLVKTLKYEARGKPLDRLKTEEELAAEQRKKLEKLEADRLARMSGNDESRVMFNHVSADDLDDNFDFGRKKTSDNFLVYKDGKLVQSEDEFDLLPEQLNNNSDDEEQSDQDGNSKDEDEDDDDDDDDDDEDNYSDVESDNNEKTSDESEENELSTENLSKEKILKKPLAKLKRRKIDEIPYVLEVPVTFEEFLKLVDGYSSSDQAIVIERIIKCNHPKLKADNKEKLEEFYNVLLQYVDHLTRDSACHLDTLDKLIPFLYELAHLSPLSAANCFVKMLTEKRNNYIKNSVQYLTGIQSAFPDLDTLVIFQLILILFPTSDFRHKVVTPALLFMGQILSECRPNSRQEIAKGLYLCSVFFEYISLSKRFVPEVLNYLSGILSLAINCNELEKSSLVIPPFKSSMKATLMLDSPEKSKNIVWRSFKLHELADSEDFTDEFRVNAVWMCCELLVKFAELYQELPSFPQLFRPIEVWMKKLPLTHYPREVRDTIESLDVMLRTRHLLTPLMRARKRPQSIKFFEPKIEAEFTGHKSKKKISTKSGESERLKHIVKRETKGALRELRRDNQFLAQHQLQEQIDRDADRKRKVKELYSVLSNQEGDYKSLMKKKRKE
uniref:Nucleolar protein 14 n=1 Tax=Strigamia maritima TaxID=126957 RepID=T1IJG7_STRMM